MKKSGMAILSAVLIIGVSIYGVAYADNVKAETQQSSKQILGNQEAIKLSQTVDEDSKETGSNDSCHSSKDEKKDMVKIMRENGFEDAAKYMQTGDYEKMSELMNNLGDEDYQRMIDIMEENGYGSMAKMMKSIGREGMIKMHNSMGSVYTGNNGMMGGLGVDI